MCTIVVWADNGIADVSARNMDWFENMATDVWVFPRGMQRAGLPESDGNPLRWTSRYGSIAASVYDIATADGVNEAGLGMHMLWLDEADYGQRDSALPGLCISLWGQFFLDNFATVAESVQYAHESPFQVVTVPFSGAEYAATAHLQLEDSTGDIAVFEYVEGTLNIFHDRAYRVMTNSPVFEKQIENLKQYKGFGGTADLPGTSDAADRFVRAAYYMQHLRTPNSALEAIAGAISVARNVAQPFIDLSRPHADTSPTLWRTVIDHTDLTYYFESTMSPYLTWIDASTLSFAEGTPVMRLPLSNDIGSFAGDSSDRLVPSEPFVWAMP